MTNNVSESRFYMWRAIFALAHADHIVTDEEYRFMQKALDTENFSAAQRAVLELDREQPQEVMPLFMKIEDQEDRSRFFYFARMMCWSDGNFDEQEQKIMLALETVHVRNIDFDKALASVDMELDEEQKEMIAEDMERDSNPFMSFFRRFWP